MSPQTVYLFFGFATFLATLVRLRLLSVVENVTVLFPPLSKSTALAVLVTCAVGTLFAWPIALVAFVLIQRDTRRIPPPSPPSSTPDPDA